MAQRRHSGIPMFTYRDLIVWQQGLTLVEECYRLTTTFPRSELFGLTSQLRRAAVSIPANVAEGHCRRETKPYRHHVSIAIGSHGELETYFELAFRLGYLSKSDKTRAMQLSDSVGRLLSGLHRSLKRKIAQGPSSP
jgi:four helix bundle protein